METSSSVSSSLPATTADDEDKMEISVEPPEVMTASLTKVEENDDDKAPILSPVGPPPLDKVGGDTSHQNGDDEENNGDEGDDDEPESSSECLDDPHFATICSFMDKFGPLLRLDVVPYDDLQAMLESTTLGECHFVRFYLPVIYN